VDLSSQIDLMLTRFFRLNWNPVWKTWTRLPSVKRGGLMVRHPWMVAVLLSTCYWFRDYPWAWWIQAAVIFCYFFYRSVDAGVDDRRRGIHEILTLAGVRPVEYFWGRALPVLKEYAIYIPAAVAISFAAYWTDPSDEASFLTYWPLFLMGSMALAGLPMFWTAIGLFAADSRRAWLLAAAGTLVWAGVGGGLIVLAEYIRHFAIMIPGIDILDMLVDALLRLVLYWALMNLLLLFGPRLAYGLEWRCPRPGGEDIADAHLQKFFELSVRGFGILLVLIVIGFMW